MVRVELGTDGARGPWGEAVTAETGFQLGAAAVDLLSLKKWVLVQDTRDFNDELAEATITGLASQGASSINLGILPTPAAALIASKLSKELGEPVGAISHSASHCEAKDAGVKVFGAAGKKLDNETNKQLEVAANQLWVPSHAGLINPKTSDMEREALRDDYLQIVLSSVDEELLASRFLLGKTIVIDVANGAAHWSAPEIMNSLGANVITIFDDPKGEINKDCGATHPEEMQRMTSKTGASYGMALDGDADRLIAFSRANDQERLLDGDDALAIAAIGLDKVGKFKTRGIVVTTYSNLGLKELMHEMNADYVEVENGDRNVATGMIENAYPIGGENSGHTLFNNVAEQTGLTLTGDGTITALQELQYETLIGQPLLEVSSWEKLPHIREDIHLPAGVKAEELMARPDVNEAILAIEQDFGSEGRSLVRASGTEPVVRILVKHRDPVAARQISAEFRKVINNAV